MRTDSLRKAQARYRKSHKFYNLRMTKEEYEKLSVLARKNNVSVNAYIMNAVYICMSFDEWGVEHVHNEDKKI